MNQVHVEANSNCPTQCVALCLTECAFGIETGAVALAVGSSIEAAVGAYA